MTTATKTRDIRINAREHANAHDALVELNFSGDRAISIGSRFFTVSEAEYRRIESLGVQPTTWHHVDYVHDDGRVEPRIMSVPGRN